MKFVLNDETQKNCYGFRVLNAGIDFSRFSKNPVMLLQHDQSKIIGRWKNWEIVGSELIMECEFDEADELAMQTKGKVERGFLKGSSMGIHITRMEYSTEDDTDLVATSCELCEGSLAAVPANSGAVCLYDAKMAILSTNDITTLCAQIAKDDNKQQPNNKDMDKVVLTAAALTALSLNQDASAEAISNAIVALQQRCNDATTALQRHQESIAISLVDQAVTDGKITADLKDRYLELAKTNYDLAKSTLDGIPGKQSLAARVTNSGNAGSAVTGLAALSWDDLDKSGKLYQLKMSDPETYAQKFEQKFGRKPNQ